MIAVCITCKDRNEARRIARHLVDLRLVGSVNMFPIESMYWWEGKVVEDSEYVIIAKTEDDKFSLIDAEVGKVHSYKVPCVLSYQVIDAREDYARWLAGVVGDSAQGSSGR